MEGLTLVAENEVIRNAMGSLVSRDIDTSGKFGCL